MSTVLTKISVLIPTHGRPDLLQRTLNSLSVCALPECYRQLIVVENGSRDGAEEVVKGLPERLNARYIHYEEGNKSAALNFVLIGLDSDDLVVFFDDDVRIDKGLLVAYSEAAADAKEDSFFAGPMGVDYESPPDDVVLPYLPPSAIGWEWTENRSIEKPVAMGCNWAAKKSTIERLGGFDPNRGPGAKSGSVGQETDMMARMIENGVYGSYVPKAKVWHYVPKERCSKKWVLRRKYRVGISFSLKSPLDDSRSIFGYPLWGIRKLITLKLHSILKMPPGNKKGQMKILVDYWVLKGMLVGNRDVRMKYKTES